MPFEVHTLTDIMSNEDSWYCMLEKLKTYIDQKKKRPSSVSKNKYVKKLGVWYGVQINNYNKNLGIMTDKNVLTTWVTFIKDNKYAQYFMKNDGRWKDMLNKLKNYIDKNAKRPSSEDKDNNIKTLGKWCLQQVQNYMNKTWIMKDKNIYDTWTEFITDDKYGKYFVSNNEKWKNMLEKLRQYINVNKKRPSNKDKNTDIKQLGCWCGMQIKNYRENIGIMKDKDISKLWSQFATDYKQYFLSNEDEWKLMLEKYKQYIDKYELKPSTTDKNNDIRILATWGGTQTKNYRGKTQIMANENISKLWTEFITGPKYKEYFTK